MISQFTLSHLGGGDPVLAAKLLHVGANSDNMLQYAYRTVLSRHQLTYLQMVRREGQSNDMRHQVAHPSSRMEGRVARVPQEPRLIPDHFKRAPHAYQCYASRPA